MKKLALVGGGPAALFMFKRLVEAGFPDLEVTIFEQHSSLGAGMPYSTYGAAKEHITNVSDNEIPDIKTHLKDWIPVAPSTILNEYSITPKDFNEYKVLPRLLFGEYLSAQFNLLLKEAQRNKVASKVYLNTRVADVIDLKNKEQLKIITEAKEEYLFDKVIICTGHSWPCETEKSVANWFDSPYPPQKLFKTVNYEVAIRGASLTAIDAVKTLARANGYFIKNDDGTYAYFVNKESKGFKIMLHAIGGLLPALRFHLEDSHLEPEHLFSEEEIIVLKEKNKGFVPLDLVYDLNFKKVLEKKNPELHQQIKAMAIEEFVPFMMAKRKRADAFELMKEEYEEAEISIENKESVIWKETLGALSYAMNYPAKHFSAEDMLRLKKVMMPLIAVIIAYVPQGSARELMALHEAGLLDILDVDPTSKVVPGEKEGCIYWYSGTKKKAYKMFIDAVGQKPFFYNQIPFEGLKNKETISAAYLRFAKAENAEQELSAGNKQIIKEASGDYLLQLPGININDHFQPLDIYGVANTRLYIMAVPFIAGINPDFSGLDFCEAASGKIIEVL